MPQNGVYDLLKMLEIALDEGYSVLKYTVVNKREIETLIDGIYQSLPIEVKDAKILFNGSLVTVKRGTCITSIRKLAAKWGWSLEKTVKFLKELEI